MTLCKIFNVPASELLEEEKGQPVLSDAKRPTLRKKNTSHIYDLTSDEIVLIGYYRAGSDEMKEDVLEYIKRKNKE